MKIQLSRQFEKEDYSRRGYLKKEDKEERRLRDRKFSFNGTQFRRNHQITNPLQEELDEYKPRINSVKTSQSKAYTKMKKYMNHQEIKLKHIRLEATKYRQNYFEEFQNPEEMGSSEDLKQILSINDFFKNQERDTYLYQNGLLNDILKKRALSIDNTVKSLQLKPAGEPSSFSTSNNQPEIDRAIAFHKQNNKKLLNQLFKQKTEIKNASNPKLKVTQEEAHPLKIQPASGSKIRLKNSKTTSTHSVNETRSVSPTISLLFQLRNLSQAQLKKQTQLDAILKNQHLNRSRNLDDKTNYYSDSVSLKRINASTMFKTRKIMNERLLHRLKASKDQGKNFSDFLIELKASRVKVCDSMEKILERIRQALVLGKIVREQDFTSMVNDYKGDSQLSQPVNVGILHKIKSMMT